MKDFLAGIPVATVVLGITAFIVKMMIENPILVLKGFSILGVAIVFVLLSWSTGVIIRDWKYDRKRRRIVEDGRQWRSESPTDGV